MGLLKYAEIDKLRESSLQNIYLGPIYLLKFFYPYAGKISDPIKQDLVFFDIEGLQKELQKNEIRYLESRAIKVYEIITYKRPPSIKQLTKKTISELQFPKKQGYKTIYNK